MACYKANFTCFFSLFNDDDINSDCTLPNKPTVVNDELQEMWNYKTTKLVMIIRVPAKIRSQDTPNTKKMRLRQFHCVTELTPSNLMSGRYTRDWWWGLCFSAKLRSVGWQLDTDVSGQPIVPIPLLLDWLTPEERNERPFRKLLLPNTNQLCLTSQKSEGLNYTAAEDWDLAVEMILLL
jgi:hypothetical protein